ncbi:MAG: response regulator [Chloroflexota bacterium]|nr:response regulator [Chloroflexota bacterium]
MAREQAAKPVEVLLVEDDPGDVLLTQETLLESKIQTNLHVVGDGVEALAFLRKEGAYASVPRPDLILLDLNMPRKDGREVLADVKEDPDLKTIPVAVLTTSSQDEDILKSYQLHANCYITKPVGLEHFSTVVQSLEDFWFAIVKLPPK